jgi:hypothetical protein
MTVLLIQVIVGRETWYGRFANPGYRGGFHGGRGGAVRGRRRFETDGHDGPGQGRSCTYFVMSSDITKKLRTPLY